jgi:flavin-dependent dehydrogenase
MTDRSTPTPAAGVGRNPEVDVVVIGAGPAGSVAAVTAARAGRQVMLLERAAFPREKVCGCCIAPRGVDELASAGLEAVLDHASRLECVRLEGGQRSAVITRDSGVAISRGALDARLVEAARAAGVAVHHGASASVVRDGSVEVTIDGVTRPIRARACVVADGLAGRSLDAHPGVRWCVARDSRIGLGAILAAGSVRVGHGEILMRVERGGYVGAVELEDGRIDVAAALDHAVIRDEGPAAAIANRLGAAVVDRRAIDAARWSGTPWLTRRRTTLALPGILVAGDAAGYVEPFTGEGMSWAIATGRGAGALAARMVDAPALWSTWPGAWTALIGRDRWRCMLLARMLRSPTLVDAGLRIARRWPDGAAHVARAIGRASNCHRLPEGQPS